MRERRRHSHPISPREPNAGDSEQERIDQVEKLQTPFALDELAFVGGQVGLLDASVDANARGMDAPRRVRFGGPMEIISPGEEIMPGEIPLRHIGTVFTIHRIRVVVGFRPGA